MRKDNEIRKTESENKILSEITELVAQFEKQKMIIFEHYIQVVDSVLTGNITAENEIERIMDGLLDFGDDEKFLSLYKKLCRHVFYTYPQMVGEHISMFRMQFEEKEDDDDD